MMELVEVELTLKMLKVKQKYGAALKWKYSSASKLYSSTVLDYTCCCGGPDLSSLHQDVPVSTGHVENYVLLLVLLSVFAGGTLVLLSLLLLFCHRCCMGGRRYSRWVLPAE